MRIGILALQGDWAAHQKTLENLGAQTTLVRSPKDLETIEGLVIPGGESTTMSRLSERYGLFEPLQTQIQNGLPTLGTCAGLIFLAREIEGASRNFEQKTLGVLDCRVARNAYGAQLDSFETDLDFPGLEGVPMRAVFIRAPQILETGASVETLAKHGEQPVVVRQNQIVAAAFHPEIAGESRLHKLWLDAIEKRGAKP